jgi:pimeloyl-ACP methyl ester carboxylesterase
MLKGILNKLGGTIRKNGISEIELLKSSDTQTSKRLNIFVHGYSALKDDGSKRSLLEKLSVDKTADSWLFCWPSGFVIHPMLTNLKPSDLLLLYKGNAITRGLFIMQQTNQMLSHFKDYLKEAESIGRSQFIDRLLSEISEHKLDYDQINIIGHSLGARLACCGILAAERDAISRLRIHNLFLLAGAAPVELDWLTLSTRLDGRIFNFYSRHDFVLILKPDAEKCIGRYPIIDSNVSEDRLINIETTIAHWRYWDEIAEVFKLSE